MSTGLHKKFELKFEECRQKAISSVRKRLKLKEVLEVAMVNRFQIYPDKYQDIDIEAEAKNLSEACPPDILKNDPICALWSETAIRDLEHANMKVAGSC